MKFQAIFMSAAVTVGVFTGLTLSHQQSAQAQVCVGGRLLNNLVARVDLGPCADNQAQVPTPALLPGLIGLGVGLLRKRKAQKAEVDI